MRRTLFHPRRLLAAFAIAAAIVAAIAGAGAASPAAAQSLADYDYEHLTFRGVGLGAGYLWSGRVQDTELYTLRIDLGYLGPGIRIVPSIGYWSSRIEGAEIDSLATRLGVAPTRLGPIEWSDLSLSVDAHFVWSAPLGLLTFVGGGVGLHALNGRGPAVDGTFVEDLLDDITAGVNGIAGFEVEPVNRLRVFVEGRYTVMSSLRYGAVRAGVQVIFSRGNVQIGAVPAPPAPETGRAP